MPTYSGVWTPAQVMQQAGSGLWPGVTPPGQQLYQGSQYGSGGSTGYTWVCPPGVTSISVVCIGAGGACPYGSSPGSNIGGAGAGGLGWKNNITVVPGTSYTVAAGNSWYVSNNVGGDGGDSYFVSTGTVAGFGGKSPPNGRSGGSYTGTGGGNGGAGGAGANNYPSSNSTCGGGGGAGGYSGNGGAGGDGPSNSNGAAGSGGGGGGGGGGNSDFYTGGGAGGGGVSVYGLIGTDGPGGTGGYGPTGGGGGSGGGAGQTAPTSPGYGNAGGSYGGGGAASFYGYGPGGGGAVRIMWQGPTPGTPRSFPSNAPDV